MLGSQEVDRAHAEGHCHLETAGLLDLSLRHFDNDDAMSLLWGDSSFVFWNWAFPVFGELPAVCLAQPAYKLERNPAAWIRFLSWKSISWLRGIVKSLLDTLWNCFYTFLFEFFYLNARKEVSMSKKASDFWGWQGHKMTWEFLCRIPNAGKIFPRTYYVWNTLQGCPRESEVLA